MTHAIDKMNGHALGNTACHERLPKKTKVTWYLQKDYRFFAGSRLTLLYLTGSFLIGYMEVRHSLLYYVLLL